MGERHPPLTVPCAVFDSGNLPLAAGHHTLRSAETSSRARWADRQGIQQYAPAASAECAAARPLTRIRARSGGGGKLIAVHEIGRDHNSFAANHPLPKAQAQVVGGGGGDRTHQGSVHCAIGVQAVN